MGDYVIDVDNTHLKFKDKPVLIKETREPDEIPADLNEDANPYEDLIDVGDNLNAHNISKYGVIRNSSRPDDYLAALYHLRNRDLGKMYMYNKVTDQIATGFADGLHTSLRGAVGKQAEGAQLDKKKFLNDKLYIDEKLAVNNY